MPLVVSTVLLMLMFMKMINMLPLIVVRLRFRCHAGARSSRYTITVIMSIAIKHIIIITVGNWQRKRTAKCAN